MKIDDAKVIYDIKSSRENKKPSRISVYTENYKGEFFYIDINNLIPYKNQSREYFNQEDLQGLAESIKNSGILVPLKVKATDNGKYLIISGERRYRAAKLVGINKLPCMLLKESENAEEIALLENIHREDLHPIEFLKALLLLKNKNNYTDIQLSSELGIQKSKISETFKLQNINNYVKSELVKYNIKVRRDLRIISSLTEEKQIDYIEKLKIKYQEKKHTSNESEERRMLKRRLFTVVKIGDSIKMDQINYLNLSKEQTKELLDILVSAQNIIKKSYNIED